MRARTAIAVLAAALLVLGVGASQVSAKPATVSGRVPGGAPKVGGHAASSVAAVNPATARYLGVKSLPPSGRYRFRVPPGPLLVLARVARQTGKPKISSSRIAKVKSGQRKRVRVTRKRPRLRRRRSAGAHVAQGITVDLVKVSSYGSTFTNGTPGADETALEALMGSVVFEAGQRAPCDVEMYVDRQSPDFRAIEAEVALQQSPLVDPSTRVVPRYNDPRYQPTVRIQAHLTLGSDGSAVTGQVVARERNGNVHARSVAGTWGQFLDLDPDPLTRALDDIFKELCGAGLSEISGTFSGSSTISSRTNYRWNGSVVFKRLVENVPGAFGSYLVNSGLVTYIASGLSPTADCQVSGTTQINLPPGGGSIGVFGSPPNGLEPYTYSINVPAPFPGSMDVTWSSCSDPSANGTTETISLGGSPLDTGQSQQVSEHGLIYKGSYTNSSQFDAQYDWALEGH